MLQPPNIIIDIVQKFQRNIHEYHNPKYNEALIRVEFVNPFWKALGWDVDNEKGYSLNYREVIHEDELKIGRSSRAPDYAFRIGGRRIFFLETKKPAVDLKNDPAPAFQLRRYAYSAKLPISLLTDFEELIVYDCRLKPAMTDKPHIGRMMYYNFQEYVEKWDEISGIFSKEAVLQGALDRFIETTQGKRPRTEIDRDFLNDLDKWRIELARNIALRNPQLTERELNYAVQLTIDRLIFLRMCEDRDIEQYETLMALLNGNQIYRRLVELYYKADQRFNSGLFHFEEKDGANPDRLTPTLEVDDKILKEIISELYYPKCPYEFSVLPVEVLGNAYEQFLGKTITLTEGHRARIEEKPEVRKAGGVYYTPQYIVDYIVKNTVGKLCEGKTPQEVSELRILDPACGSGSFLLGAYQYLLEWHVNWYRAEYERTGDVPHIVSVEKIHTHHVEKIHEFSLRDRSRDRELFIRGKKTKRKPTTQAIFQGKGGEWFLTTAEKKRILLNNIYGVDIDANAVEVTKLSLLLKVLEHETSETLNQQLGLWHERALPNLDSNIKCGNSLIGTDFYEGRQAGLFNEEEALRINAFDWEREFAEVFAKGGFDAVIGNPPWGAEFSKFEKEYLLNIYANKKGEAESHLYFLEKAASLIKENGLFGYITPNTWLSVLNSREIRLFLLENVIFEEIIELSKYIFKDAPDIVPILVFFSKNKKKIGGECKVKRSKINKITASNFNTENSFYAFEVNQYDWKTTFGNAYNLSLTSDTKKILKKCWPNSERLGSTCEVYYGIKTGDNQKYISERKTDFHNVKALKTGELIRYHINWKGFWLWWNPKLAGWRNQSLEVPKIVIQYIRKLSLKRRIISALDEEGIFYPLNNYSYIQKSNHVYDLKYVLGILNSSLMNFYYSNTFIDYNIKPTYLKELPISKIDFSETIQTEKYNQLISLVDQINEVHKKYYEAKDPHTRELIQRQIAATDRQIDQLVYKLYGLTEEEIRIVESAE